MIELRHISKKYPVNDTFFYALNDVSVIIRDGEMVAVMGKSGAGKSTLLHIIGCLDTVSMGEYILNGTPISGYSEKKLAQLRNTHFGFVLQDFALIQHRTALYNVMVPLLFGKTPYRIIKKKAMEALAQIGMAEYANKEISKMSGGQKQRIAIARALVQDPPVIIADEPTGNLDSATASEIMDIFKQLNSRGKTVVIVTHDETVAAYCSRKIALSDGKICNNHGVL